MATRAFVITTGFTAWLGGLATAFAVSSCDVETCMNPDVSGCTPLPVERQGLEDEDELPLRDPAAGTTCDRMAHPSVYVVAVHRVGDMVRAVDVDAVWYEHDGRTHEATCVQGGNGCVGWLAGIEQPGVFSVSTEYCDNVVSQTVRVGPTDDGCHVDTALVMLDVTTLGCLTAASPPAGLPPEPPRDEAISG